MILLPCAKLKPTTVVGFHKKLINLKYPFRMLQKFWEEVKNYYPVIKLQALMLVTLSSTTILFDRADQEGYPQKDRVSSQRSVELYAG
jgi:hypothetical protein